MAKILAVEDHIDTLMALAAFLRSHGHIVVTADGYQAAMDAARSQGFDLLLADVSLWDGDGHALFQDLRALPGHSQLVGIAVTGRGLPEDHEDSSDLGFAAHVVKPIKLEQLMKAIERSLSAGQPESAM